MKTSSFYYVAIAMLIIVLSACSTEAPEFKEGEVDSLALGSVNSFTLINANTDMPISGYNPIPNNATIDLNSLPTDKLNIRANTSGKIGSVKFGYNGNKAFEIQWVAPYAFADDSGSNYKPWTPSTGEHTVTATPYAQGGARGQAGNTKSLNFTVTRGSSTSSSQPSNDAFTVRLINADNNRVISGYTNLGTETTIDLSKLPTRNLNIEVTGKNIGSVRFDLNGKKLRTESFSPYAMTGDRRGNFFAWKPDATTYELDITTYSSRYEKGTQKSRSLTLRFTNAGTSAPAPSPAPTPSPEPVNNGGSGHNAVKALANDGYGQVRYPNIPSNAVRINAGQDIQSVLNRHGAGTTFVLSAGVYRNQSIILDSQDVLIGEYGAILDGANTQKRAVRGGTNGALRNVEIRNYIDGTASAVEGTYGFKVENNYIHHNGGTNLGLADNMQVRNNKITHGGKYGIISVENKNIVVEHNEISYNNTGNYSSDHGAGASKFAGGLENSLIRRNYVHHNMGKGLWVDYKGRNNTIEENLLDANTDHQILYEISYSGQIKGNVILNGARFGIQVSNSVDVKVHDNLLEGNASGLTMRVACRTAVQHGARNVEFYNNTVYQKGRAGGWPQGKAAYFAVLDNSCGNWGATKDQVYTKSGNRFYNNTYHLSDGANFYYRDRQMTLSEWQTNGYN